MALNEVVLNEVMKETADAIREKTGKSELIKPVDFAEEIKGISGGGGDAPSAMEYWDVSANVGALSELALFCTWAKASSEYGISILSAYYLETKDIQPKAIALDKDAIIAMEGSKMTISDFFEASGLPDFTQLGWVRITKEQFYDLNA